MGNRNHMKFITIEWYVEDIQPIIEAEGMQYSEELAYSILEYIKDTHDANIGVNWDVINNAVRMFKEMEDTAQ
jgi:hypothetical protein